MLPVTWAIICNPENRRQRFFTEALMKHKNQTPIIISYSELMNANQPDQYLLERLGCIKNSQIQVKIESPGENFEVTKALISYGATVCGKRLTPEMAKQIPYDKGRFKYLKEWFLGFQVLLTNIDSTLKRLAKTSGNRLCYLNTPEAILQMLDKLHCQQSLSENGIATPGLLTVPEEFSALLNQLRTNQRYSVFIKPRYGSSASGVMALRVKPDGSQCIVRTSLELTKVAGQTRCYNSLKIRTYNSINDIAELYETVFAEDAYVEQWLPKPQIQGENFDLRVVVIDGQATHHVTRYSKSPMTNLHLGNQRGNVLDHNKGRAILFNAYRCAEQAASVIPGAKCLGADVVSSSSRSTAHIIELNSFGDLLPGVHHRGLTTYDTQINATLC